MKRFVIVLLVLFLLMLSACGNKSTETNEIQSEVSSEIKTEESEKTEESASASSSENEKEEVSSEIEEEPTPDPREKKINVVMKYLNKENPSQTELETAYKMLKDLDNYDKAQEILNRIKIEDKFSFISTKKVDKLGNVSNGGGSKKDAVKYDSQGRVVEHSIASYPFFHCLYGDYLSAERVVCQYNNDNTANKKIYSGSVLVAVIESLYDEDGKCLTESVQFNDKQDEVIYEYDIEGRLVKRSHKGCTMYYSYDESGKLIEWKQDYKVSGYGIKERSLKFNYDSSGLLTEIEEVNDWESGYDENEYEAAVWTLKYNQEGQIVHATGIPPEGTDEIYTKLETEIVRSRVYTYHP